MAEKGGGKVRRKRTMARWRHSENPLYTFDHPSGLYDKLHRAVQATESKNCSNHLPARVSLHSRGE